MEVNVINEYGNIDFDYEKIVKDVSKAVFDRLKVNKDASLILVDRDYIHMINKEYRHVDRETDVISFEEDDLEEQKEYLGDIFICIPKAYDQAKEYGHSVEREFAFLLCHGLLHLHSYDHMTKEDEEVMFKLQDEILDKTIYKRK